MITFELKVERPDFSLNVSGEFGDGITAIFGPSGAGKTTLLNCLAGVLRPSRGFVEIDGQTVYSEINSVWVAPEKRRIGTVYQDGALFPHMTVRGNIEFGWKLLPLNDRTLDPLEIADFLGLTAHLDKKPNELSGGERQRVAIARALATSPKLLLLDEPLASLDVARKGSILNYLSRVHAEFAIPMVYVSHSVSEVVAIASQALLVRDGKAEGFDRPSSLLLSNPSLDTGVERFENVLEGVVSEVAKHTATVDIDGTAISTPKISQNPGDEVVVSIGANQIILAAVQPDSISARNIKSGQVTEVWSREGKAFVEVDVGPKLIAELTENALVELGISVGSEVFLVFKSSSVNVYDA